MNEYANIIGLIMALGVVPALYFVFRSWMAGKDVHPLCRQGYFNLFGVVGGYFLAVGLSPSGLAAMCVLFLMTAAPGACLLVSVRLTACRERGRIENVAMTLGYAYPVLLLLTCVGGVLSSGV